MKRMVFFIVITLAASGSLHAQVPQTERDALIALYNSTDGPNWIDDSNWLGALGTECTWFGVSCLANNVQIINLNSNGLYGSIPSQLVALPFLHELALETNQLSGNIPPELGSLPELLVLKLGNNQLIGNLPPELGNLSNLTFLGATNNQLSGEIPPELGNLTSLVFLSICTNNFTGGIPPALGTLPALEFLHLRSNQLSETIPPELGNLSNLVLLELAFNQLSGSIPPELGNLSNLQRLYLNSNSLSGGIPAELGNLGNLELLYLQDNHLGGDIPAELGNLNSLDGFNLSSNQLSGNIPTELANLSNLDGAFTGIGYNALWTDDPILQAFLDSRIPDWDLTQTIAPANIATNFLTSSSFVVSWTPILYTADEGWYEIAATPLEIFSDGFETGDTGMWGLAGPTIPISFMTIDKTDTSILVDGLQPNTEYQFVVWTVTEPHGSNQNQVISEPSDVILVTTHP